MPTAGKCARAKGEQAEPVITLSVQDAKRLYQLYENCEAADAIFKSCQSTQFRNHVKSAYTAANVAGAFQALRQSITDAEKEETPS